MLQAVRLAAGARATRRGQMHPLLEVEEVRPDLHELVGRIAARKRATGANVPAGLILSARDADRR